MGAKFKSLPPISDDEEAEIQREIASDPDNPELTEEEMANMKPFAEVFPELAAKMRANLGGRPKLENPKKAISIRLDTDVIEKFKRTGAGWQARMNDVLKKAKVG